MLKSAGTRIKVAQVANISPPMTARPSGAFCPGSIGMGNMPMIIALVALVRRQQTSRSRDDCGLGLLDRRYELMKLPPASKRLI